MGGVLCVVYRCIATHPIKKAGCPPKTTRTGSVTLIQRFAGALNSSIHFHMFLLDGMDVERPDCILCFRWVTAPSG